MYIVRIVCKLIPPKLQPGRAKRIYNNGLIEQEKYISLAKMKTLVSS